MPGGGGQERQHRGRGSGREESPAGGPGACGVLTASGHLRGPPARPRGALRPAGGQRQGGPGRQASRPPLRSAPRRQRAAGRSPRREVVMVSRVTCARGSPGAGGGGGGGGEASVTDGAAAAASSVGPRGERRCGGRCPPQIRAPARSHLRRRPPLSRCPRASRGRASSPGCRPPAPGSSPFLLLSPCPLPPPS